jgi:hypothetical protein
MSADSRGSLLLEIPLDTATRMRDTYSGAMPTVTCSTIDAQLC